MSSRDIAELTGKEHKHVMRDIRAMLGELGLDFGGYVQNWTNPQNGQKYPVYALPKDLTITLVAGYNVVMRHRIVTRWQELEALQGVPAIPRSLPEALRLAADEAEKRAAAEAALAIAQPKADALDRIATADGSVCVTNAAKDLQMQPKKLFAWLQEHKWIYRRQGGKGWLAYQDRIQSGHLEHKVTTVERGDGTEKVIEQVLVTPKGLSLLSRYISAEVAA